MRTFLYASIIIIILIIFYVYYITLYNDTDPGADAIDPGADVVEPTHIYPPSSSADDIPPNGGTGWRPPPGGDILPPKGATFVGKGYSYDGKEFLIIAVNKLHDFSIGDRGTFLMWVSISATVQQYYTDFTIVDLGTQPERICPFFGNTKLFIKCQLDKPLVYNGSHIKALCSSRYKAYFSIEKYFSE